MRERRTPILYCCALLIAAVSQATVGGIDIRIGDDTNARAAKVDFDPDSGHLYAVVEWEDGWTFHISTDDGQSWNQRYSYSCLNLPMIAVDMAVSGTWVYVGYSCSAANQDYRAKMRRFELDTGNLDLDYGAPDIVNTLPEIVVDLALETNIDSNDDKIYYALVQSDGDVRFFHDDPTDGTTFTEEAIAFGNASGGLDLHWNPGFATHSLFLSGVDLDDDIQVWRYDGGWSQATSFSYAGSQTRTAISAFADRVVTAYLAPTANGQGVAVRHSDNGGDTWSSEATLFAPSAGGGDALDVNLTARGGAGLALVFNLESGVVDTALIRFKGDYEPGPWTEPRPFSDYDPFTGRPIALSWTPDDSYAVIYVGGADELPYFDRIESPAIFLDGFETGDLSAWSDSLPRHRPAVSTEP